LLVKNEDFHLYSVEKGGKPYVLKVMCDPDLFYAELAVFNRIKALQTGASDSEKLILRLTNYFQFQTPLTADDVTSSQYSSDGGVTELDHFYLLFETCSTNLYQMITIRKQKFAQQMAKQGRLGSEAQSMSSFNNVVRLEGDKMNMFREQEMVRLVSRLVDLFAALQEAKVVHRNIKPANLVFSIPAQNRPKQKHLQFEDLIVCNFEMAICFAATLHPKELVCAQDERCSAIYASPLVQKKVNLLGDKTSSDIVIEVAENQEESFDALMSVSSERVNLRQDFAKAEQDTNRLNWAAAKFDPFVEDVFSLGLTLLQVAYQCSGPELKFMRQDPDSLTRSIEQLNDFYSVNLCCILLLMLQWESECRPDFIRIKHLLPNIMALSPEDATNLFRWLCSMMTADESAQQIKSMLPTSAIKVSTGRAVPTMKAGREEEKTSV